VVALFSDPPPIISTELSPLIDTFPGKEVEIDCPDLNDRREETGEDEDITCIWYKNAVPITSLNDTRIKVEDGTLSISNAKTSDAGLYQVMIRNNGGEIIGLPTYLIVNGISKNNDTNRSNQSMTNVLSISQRIS
jgi:hypothetical protein